MSHAETIIQAQKKVRDKEMRWAHEHMRLKSFSEIHIIDKALAKLWAGAYPIMSATTVVACMFFLAFDWSAFIQGQYDTGMYVLSGLTLIFFAAGAVVNERVKATSLNRFFSLKQHKKQSPAIHISNSTLLKAIVSSLLSIFLSTWGYVDIAHYSVDNSIEIQNSHAAVRDSNRVSLSTTLDRVNDRFDNLIAGQKELLATSFSNAARYKTRRFQINQRIVELETQRAAALAAERSAYVERKEEVDGVFSEDMMENDTRAETWALVAAVSTLIGEILYILAVSFLCLYAAKISFETSGPRSSGDANLDLIQNSIYSFKAQNEGRRPSKSELFKYMDDGGLIGKSSEGKLPKSTFYRLTKTKLPE